MSETIDVGMLEPFDQSRDVQKNQVGDPIPLGDFLKDPTLRNKPKSNISIPSVEDALRLHDEYELKKTKDKRKEFNKKIYNRRVLKSGKLTSNMKETMTAKKGKSNAKKDVAKKGPKHLTKDTEIVNFVVCNKTSAVMDGYKSGARCGLCVVIGNPKYGNTTTKNAFQLLRDEQSMLISTETVPEWVIISRDDVTLLDHKLGDTLKGLKGHTMAVGCIGITSLKRNGKFYRPESQDELKGMVINSTDNEFTFVKSLDYDNVKTWRVATISSGFIAVRGSVFIDIDFSYMADNCKSGHNHIYADISMEVNKRGGVVGVVKTLIRQEDSFGKHADEHDFIDDHTAFLQKWIEYLPVSV